MDEVSLYNRTLSPGEIMDIFNFGSNGKCFNCALCSTLPDADGDNFVDVNCGGTDCDDMDASINPEAIEICDGIDNNCDGLIDTADPNLVDNEPPVITVAALILQRLKEFKTADRGRGEFEVACEASDNCSVTAIGLMMIPQGFDNPNVEIEFKFEPGVASAINFHENKKGKHSIELIGANQVALLAQLADIFAIGGVLVTDGQLLDLRFRVRKDKGQKNDFDFVNGILVQEKVIGEDPQTITMVCTAMDVMGEKILIKSIAVKKGLNEYRWDAKNVICGTYLAELKVDDKRQIRRFVLIN